MVLKEMKAMSHSMIMRDMTTRFCKNIGNEDNVGIFDWNEIDAEIDERNRDCAQRLPIPQSEESNHSYSIAPCQD